MRAATRDDLPRILEIHNDAVLTTTAVFHYAPQTLDERDAWFDARLAGGWPVVAVADAATDQLLGYGSSAGRACRPTSCPASSTRSTSTRTRAGAASAGRRWSRSSRRPTTGGYRTDDRRRRRRQRRQPGPARRSLGFEDVARFREVGFKFGRWLDLCFLQKMLRGPETPLEG